MKPFTSKIVRSRISKAKFLEIVRLFSYDLSATQIAQVTSLNRNTVNRYVSAIREMIAHHCDEQSPITGTVEIDESYFGARRVRGKRGRGARGKTIVFGIYKRNGSVYTQIVPNVSRAALQQVLRGRVTFDSIIHSDGWRAYNGLVDVGYKRHYRINHEKNEFAKGSSHINGIEGFWGFAKTRLSKFRGLSKSTFYLHLKECEFRFNNRKNNIYQILLKLSKLYNLI
ncbi:MAG: IS1595 family transposase [Candidatus Kapaibacterium sp.]